MAGKPRSAKVRASRDATPAAKPRGRPRDQDSQETRAAIIAAAQRLFGEAGYKGVSVERLARECGLTVRALYHYFPSKRALFKAATDEAFHLFGTEVADRVFIHESLTDRIDGFIDVYRTLHATNPHVLAFIGMVLVDTFSVELTTGGKDSASSTDLANAALPVQALNELLVDQAFARGEVHPDVDRDGAMLLLQMVGLGLALTALNDTGAFPQMLDALQRLNDGTLYRPRAGARPDKK